MARIVFTPNLERHLDCPPVEVAAHSVRQALDRAFSERPRLRGYRLDDQGELRKHVMVFVDGQQLSDRDGLDTKISENAELYVMQALSGG